MDLPSDSAIHTLAYAQSSQYHTSQILAWSWPQSLFATARKWKQCK